MLIVNTKKELTEYLAIKTLEKGREEGLATCDAGVG